MVVMFLGADLYRHNETQKERAFTESMPVFSVVLASFRKAFVKFH